MCVFRLLQQVITAVKKSSADGKEYGTVKDLIPKDPTFPCCQMMHILKVEEVLGSKSIARQCQEQRNALICSHPFSNHHV